MKTKILGVLAAVGFVAALAVLSVNAADPKDTPKEGDHHKAIMTLDMKKIEETEVKNESIGEPKYGYVGCFGTFEATKKTGSGMDPVAVFVVHHHPSVDQNALGQTKLTYEGTKRLGNVDGWVFKTEWDGKYYPSKVFCSAEKVYFGGGVTEYIVADFRTETGWTWKLHPMKRMELVTAGKETKTSTESKESPK